MIKFNYSYVKNKHKKYMFIERKNKENSYLLASMQVST